MMRIGIPNGILSSTQLRVIGGLTRKYARNLADITVRQNIQLHWLTIESLPEIVDALTAIGLSPKGACGDVVRNVTGCPLAGVAADEILDASPIAREVAHLLTANPEFYNSRANSKSPSPAAPPGAPTPRSTTSALPGKAQRPGRLLLRVGGGLSNEPHLAVRLDAFILPHQAVHVVRAVTEIFRDQQGLRESRDRARLKYLFMKEGWTAESFLAELQSRLDFTLLPGIPEHVPDDVLRDHAGIHPQRTPGLSYIGASVLRGRLTGEQLEAAADLADRYGSGALRATVSQNLLFIDIPNEKVAALAAELGQIGLYVEGSSFWRGAVACTGTEFCKLAITETKGFTRWLVGELEERLPQFDQQLRLHVTGCPNSCGQHWIADIGIEARRSSTKASSPSVLLLPRRSRRPARFHRPPRRLPLPRTHVPESIERLLRRYLITRQPEENLRAWFGRHSNEDLHVYLSGKTLHVVERDLPAGRVPHAVAD